MKASKFELLALLHQAAPVADVEVEPASTLKPVPEPVAEPPASTWSEVLRPDLRGPLGLEALDAEPPEPAPYSRLVWVRDLGCWLDGTVIISTVKTTPERNRFYRAQRAAQQEATASTCGTSPLSSGSNVT